MLIFQGVMAADAGGSSSLEALFLAAKVGAVAARSAVPVAVASPRNWRRVPLEPGSDGDDSSSSAQGSPVAPIAADLSLVIVLRLQKVVQLGVPLCGAETLAGSLANATIRICTYLLLVRRMGVCSQGVELPGTRVASPPVLFIASVGLPASRAICATFRLRIFRGSLTGHTIAYAALLAFRQTSRASSARSELPRVALFIAASATCSMARNVEAPTAF